MVSAASSLEVGMFTTEYKILFLNTPTSPRQYLKLQIRSNCAINRHLVPFAERFLFLFNLSLRAHTQSQVEVSSARGRSVNVGNKDEWIYSVIEKKQKKHHQFSVGQVQIGVSTVRQAKLSVVSGWALICGFCCPRCGGSY